MGQQQFLISPIQYNSTLITQMDFLIDFLCGCISGLSQVAVMQPFQIIKVKLINQSTAKPIYNGIADCARKIIKQEGYLGLYKGSATVFLGVGALVSLQFGSNQLFKELLLEMNENDEIPNIELFFLAGLSTGIPSSIATTPIDLTRIAVQSQTKNGKYKSSIDAARKIYHNYGIKGLYLGFYSTLLRQTLAMSFYFGVYQLVMRMFVSEGKTSLNAPITAAFFSGGIAGMASWVFTYPIDYVKTLVQSDHHDNRRFKSALDCARIRYKADGLRCFFTGLGVTMLRSFPVNGVGFLTFEWMMRITGRRVALDEQQRKLNDF